MVTLNVQKQIIDNNLPLPAGPCIMVIFGASGDLTKRKLYPALYNLAASQCLSDNFAVVGIGRKEMSDEQFSNQLSGNLCDYVSCEINPGLQQDFAKRLFYFQGNFDDGESYKRLAEKLKKVDDEYKTQGNYLYYLATPPSLFGKIVEKLHATGLVQETNGSWRRVIIEKPFGKDYESARTLNIELQKYFDESQIYRIDHYLGKETVQNILVFRFANGIFEPIWNRRYIDHVQITVSEALGVEHRAGYYEEAGALRDMVSNHLLQLLSYVAMEPPNSFDAEAVRNEKAKILQAIQPIAPEEVLSCTVRGQYRGGKISDGTNVLAYRSEANVAADSKIETFVALKLRLDNWRWADVPFYLRTGKRMAKHKTEIAIYFKRAPFTLFRETSIDNLETNVLVLRIQPNEGISLSFSAKIPGTTLQIRNMEMDFCYSDYFGDKKVPIGYETLLYDCMKGDTTLFLRADNIERAWRVLTPILDIWSTLPPQNFPNYAAGSWGPEEADRLLANDGRQWRNG